MLDLPARCVCGILAFGSPVEWARARVAHKDLQFQEDLLLLEAGIAETSALPSLGEASRAGNLEVVVARLHWGADPNERDKVHPKYTPLHRATCGGHRSALRLLLAARAAPNARDRLGFCVLHFAANQQTGIVADLIQAVLLFSACDVNAKNLQGLTPLHSAAGMGRADVCELLHAAGAHAYVPSLRASPSDLALRAAERRSGEDREACLRLSERLASLAEAEEASGPKLDEQWCFDGSPHKMPPGAELWLPFQEAPAAELEAAVGRGDDEVTIETAGRLYRVDFSRLEQTSMATGFVRRVARRTQAAVS
ncbi:unnamed protein product, partial [Polarella glacialis]